MFGSMKVSVQCNFTPMMNLFCLLMCNLDVAKTMDDAMPEIEQSLEPHLSQFGQRKDRGSDQSILDILESERFTQNKGPLTDVRRG